MLIFIDESGDSGFKIAKGSSKTFVIVLVIFDEDLDAEETAVTIKKLRKSLGKTDRFEFRFNKCSKEYRLKFLKAVKKCKFRIRAIVIQKDKLYSSHLKTSKDSFYNFSLRMVLEHNNDTIADAKLRLDGLGERVFRRKMTVYLRKNLNKKIKKVMKNLRFKDSKRDVLIQLADMIAGSIRRCYDKSTKDYEEYRQVLKSKEEDVWEFK